MNIEQEKAGMKETTLFGLGSRMYAAIECAVAKLINAPPPAHDVPNITDDPIVQAVLAEFCRRDKLNSMTYDERMGAVFEEDTKTPVRHAPYLRRDEKSYQEGYDEGYHAGLKHGSKTTPVDPEDAPGQTHFNNM